MKTAIIMMSVFLFVGVAHGQFTYPLQDGNRWQYKEPPPPEEPYFYEDQVLGDTIMPNGLVYKRISRGLSGSQTDDFLRQADNRIYQFLTVTDSAREVVRFDFGRNLYDTVSAFDLFPMSPVVITLVDTGKVLAFGVVRSYKMFYWEERGGTFYRFDTVVDSIGVMSIQIEPGFQLYLAGAVINDVTYGTVVSVNPGSDVNSELYTLSQNYPNPFNPSTSIRIASPRTGFVRLTIFDITGRRIKTLVSGVLGVGSHVAIWNGKMDDGNSAASGLYIYRLEANATIISRKMLLLH